MPQKLINTPKKGNNKMPIFSPKTHRRRDNKKFRILCEDYKPNTTSNNCLVVMVAKTTNNFEVLDIVQQDGRYSDNFESGEDLLPIKKTMKVSKKYLVVNTSGFSYILDVPPNPKDWKDSCVDIFAVKEIPAFEIEKGDGIL